MSETTTPAVEHSLALIVEAMELLVKNQESITARLDNLDEFVTRLDQDLQALEAMVVEDDEKQHWSETMDKNHDLSPVIYRYSRYGIRDYLGEFYEGEIDNLGGVTYAFQIDYVTNEVYAGVSICRRDDNFDKALGRGVAKKRMEMCPITFEYDSEDTLIKAFWSKVYSMYYEDDTDPLINTLFQIDTTDFITGTVDQ